MDSITNALLVGTTSSGQALQPEDLNRMLHEYLVQLDPIWSIMRVEQASGASHEWVRRTALPTSWVEGELTDPNFQSSTYVRSSAPLKIVRTAGGVSSFQQAVSKNFINALDAELEGSLVSITERIKWLLMYGDVNDSYQFDGVFAGSFKDATADNAYTAGGSFRDIDGTVTVQHLDDMVDHLTRRAGLASDEKFIMMSQGMRSKLTGLLARIQRNVEMVRVEGGFELATYRGVPILENNTLSPNSTTTSPAVTATASAGGSLADDEWFYRITSVTDEGEQYAGTEDSATTATTNNSVTLTWTADANAYLYRVYRGTATGHDNLQLLRTIPAKSYSGTGALSTNVAQFIDDGSYTPNANVLCPATGDETIVGINTSSSHGVEIRGMRSPLGDPTDSLLTYIELATTNASFRYLIEGFMTIKNAYPEYNAIWRRARLT